LSTSEKKPPATLSIIRHAARRRHRPVTTRLRAGDTPVTSAIYLELDMDKMLLPDELLAGQIAMTRACTDATTNIMRVSHTLFSIGITWSLSTAMFIVGSFERPPQSTTSSKPTTRTLASKPKGGTRRTKAIAAV
jgi:hypothetical protein